MKVMVTGGAGYMGSVLCQVLSSAGHQVQIIDSVPNGGQHILGLLNNDGFKFSNVDVRDLDNYSSLLDETDAVVHLAAIVGDPACARDPELAKQVNFDSSMALFNLAKRKSVKRFVFASTCSNYGKMADPSKLATEETDLNPVSIYAETKVSVENSILDLAPGVSPATTILRFATLFGISPRMRFDLTVNQFAAEMLSKGYIEVYGEQFWRPYVHVRDAARAILLILTSPVGNVMDQIFNVGNTQENYQKQQLVELIQQQIGSSAEISFVHREEDPRDYRVSFEKIYNTLGFQTTRTVEDGITEVIQAIKQRLIPNWEDPRYHN